MHRFIEGADRAQASLLPASLEDYVDADNSVRVIEAFVDALDLDALGFAVIPAATGRPGLPSGNAVEAVRLWLRQPRPVQPPA